MRRVRSATTASVRERIHRSAGPSAGSFWGLRSADQPGCGCASSARSTKRPIFQSLFANSLAFCSLPSESWLSAPADTPFTSAKRSVSAPISSITPTGLSTLPFDFDIFSERPCAPETRTRPWRYTDVKGTSPMFSMPIMIMRATQKKMMSWPVSSTEPG